LNFHLNYHQVSFIEISHLKMNSLNTREGMDFLDSVISGDRVVAPKSKMVSTIL